MFMWFVINISGKQEICRINQMLDVDHIKARNTDILLLERVMFVFDDYNNKIEIGQPFLDKTLQAIIIQQIFTNKILILRFKRKKHYKKSKGYKSKKTRILIKKII